jgi:predicted nucleotidyltransferase
MNNSGLTKQDIAEIIEVLQQHSSIQSAVIFGSRAKQTYKSGSDVDIALYGRDITDDIVNQISYQLNEETNLPYKFDILNYNSIANLELKNHIDRVGVIFYEESNKFV